MTDKPAESAVERVIGFAYARGLDPWVFDMRDATSHRLDELYVFGDLGELAELSVLSLRINCIIWASEASRIREVKRQRDAALAELKAENEALRRKRDALKCCGSCRHYEGEYADDHECALGPWMHTPPDGPPFETYTTWVGDPCHFTPSRWQPRAGLDQERGES